VPSTSPPLLRSPSCLAPRRAASSHRSSEASRISWPAVLASVCVSFALVCGVFAWIATHPHNVAPSSQLMNLATLELPQPPAPPQAPVVSVTPVIHRSSAREAISRNIPLLEINSPPLPPPISQPAKQLESPKAEGTGCQLPPLPKQPAGESYGTEVLFLNNREAAADLARHEHKLLFVMHISGNFEDSCFT
jgi:hypothetical protein